MDFKNIALKLADDLIDLFVLRLFLIGSLLVLTDRFPGVGFLSVDVLHLLEEVFHDLNLQLPRALCEAGPEQQPSGLSVRPIKKSLIFVIFTL